jgi:hypothetical protein
MLKAMGIDDEKIDQIIEAHTEVTDALKTENEGLKKKAADYDTVKKELDTLKANPTDDWKDKHDKVKKEFDDYKNGIESEKTLASKKNAVKSIIENAGIKDPAIVELIMLKTKYDDIELDGDKVKDADTIKESITKDYASYVEKSSTGGARVDNPPANTGNKMTREEIYKKDDKGRYVLSTAERQKALANNPDAMKGR